MGRKTVRPVYRPGASGTHLPAPLVPGEFEGEWVGRDEKHTRDALSSACVRYGLRQFANAQKQRRRCG